MPVIVQMGRRSRNINHSRGDDAAVKHLRLMQAANSLEPEISTEEEEEAESWRQEEEG